MTTPLPMLPTDQFEPGLLSFRDVSEARQDRSYADTGFIIDELSDRAPWTLSLLYNDGAALSISLELMSFETLAGSKVTIFRRHKASGRIIPCQLAQGDRRFMDPQFRHKPWKEVVQCVVPPRFDPALTPSIMTVLNQQQMLQFASGVLRVIQLQLMNPVLFGWSSRAAAEGAAGRAILRSLAPRSASIAADATALSEQVFAQVGRFQVNRFQQFLEAARRLSLMKDVPPQVKADALEAIAGRLGLEVGGRSVALGGRILIVAKDARSALQIAADGSITFGRLRLGANATLEIINPTAIRALSL